MTTTRKPKPTVRTRSVTVPMVSWETVAPLDSIVFPPEHRGTFYGSVADVVSELVQAIDKLADLAMGIMSDDEATAYSALRNLVDHAGYGGPAQTHVAAALAKGGRAVGRIDTYVALKGRPQ